MDNYGNPDLFGTTANTYQDTFSNPMNAANMNPGWGMNPNLLTPSYEAPYRPQYSGGNGYSPFGSPGFFRSAANVFGPGQDPYWGSPVDNVQASVRSMGSRPFDAAMWGVQNIGLPALGYAGMSKILGPASSSLWSVTPGVNSIRNGYGLFGLQGAASQINSMGGLATSMWRGEGLAAGIGRGVFGGMARGLGAGAGAAGVGVAGGMGGLAMGVAIPYAAGYAATQAMDAGFITPYTNSRQNANILNRNFSNVYFGEGIGNTVTGKGLGYNQAARMGVSIQNQGLDDMMFSREDYSNIADMSSRAGLFDNVKGSRIPQRMKDIAEQIKLIVAISSDPSIKNAIEELSKLNMAGADLNGGRTSAAGRAYGQIGAFAAQAGTSVQRLMNTVGAQGQYLFQSNGMTPYLGQLAAGNSYAGFAAAQRQGILSPAALARMGGIEGATQSSLAAQVMGAQTPLAMMGAYNHFIGGAGGPGSFGPNQTVVGTVATFGALAAKDPLSALGNMTLYGNAAAGAAMHQQGSLGLQNQAITILKDRRVRPAGKDGKYSPEQLAAIMEHEMHLPGENVRAYINQLYEGQDSGVFRQRMEALDGYSGEQYRQLLNQSGNAGGWFNQEIYRPAAQGIHSLGKQLARLTTPVARAVGSAQDLINEGVDKWNYGTIGKELRVSSAEDVLNPASSYNVNFADSDSVNPLFGGVIEHEEGAGSMNQNRSAQVLSDINKIAKNPNDPNHQAAKDYLNATDADGQNKALDKLLGGNLDVLGEGGRYLSSGFKDVATASKNRSVLAARLARAGRKTESVKTASGELAEGLAETLNYGGKRALKADKLTAKDKFVGLYNVGAAMDLGANFLAKGDEQGAIEAVKKGGKYAGILELAGGAAASGEDIINTIMDINRGEQSTGRIGGLGANIFSNVKDYATAVDTSDADRQKYEVNAVKDNGGVIRGNGAGKGAAGMTSAELAAGQGFNADLNSLRKESWEKYYSGEVDFSEHKKKLGNIDQATAFGVAVDKFGRKVDEINSGKKNMTLAEVYKASHPEKEDKTNTQKK